MASQSHFGGATLAAGIAVSTLAGYRRYHLRWGATREEATCRLPGDELIHEPSFAPTRAITIDATPEEVWPWIVQIGYGRAGFYSYDLIDNLGRPSSERVLPDWQHLAIGDLAAPMSPFAHPPTPKNAFVVAGFETNRWILWTQPRSTWVWSLESLGDDRTRLVTRVRCSYGWPRPQAILSLLLMEIGDFPMMRKQLLGIKRRAEHRTPRAADCVEPTTTRIDARTDPEFSRAVTDLRLVELADIELAYADVGASLRPSDDVRTFSTTVVHTVQGNPTTIEETST